MYRTERAKRGWLSITIPAVALIVGGITLASQAAALDLNGELPPLPEAKQVSATNAQIPAPQSPAAELDALVVQREGFQPTFLTNNQIVQQINTLVLIINLQKIQRFQSASPALPPASLTPFIPTVPKGNRAAILRYIDFLKILVAFPNLVDSPFAAVGPAIGGSGGQFGGVGVFGGLSGVIGVK